RDQLLTYVPTGRGAVPRAGLSPRRRRALPVRPAGPATISGRHTVMLGQLTQQLARRRPALQVGRRPLGAFRTCRRLGARARLALRSFFRCLPGLFHGRATSSTTPSAPPTLAAAAHRSR